MTIWSFWVGVLAAVALAGCDRQPANRLEGSRTNVPSAAVAIEAGVVSNALPLRTIFSLSQGIVANGNNAVARIRGTVLDARPGEFIVINDGTGTLFAETRQTVLPGVKTPAELSGQPVADGFSVRLLNAAVHSLATDDLANSEVASAPVEPSGLPLLTNIWEIRDLPAERAARHYPVRLRAVVTVNTKANHYFFAHDDSAGISVLTSGTTTNLTESM